MMHGLQYMARQSESTVDAPANSCGALDFPLALGVLSDCYLKKKAANLRVEGDNNFGKRCQKRKI